ncbi:MAG TPA: efflux RND transporter periplasmic adaptor subunit [Burkholderiales bacterium]|nr:efflux RND transporter periplasmic adaptor subunit [Burkholderiales bacterium]
MTKAKMYGLLLALGISTSVHAGQPLGCLIEPHQVAEVGSPVIGVVQEVLVERGDRVAKGQVIALLRADVERAALAVAHSRSQAEAEEEAARANLGFARQKLERAKDLLEKQFISQQALDQVRTEYELAEQKLVQAKEQNRVARRELGLAAAQVAQRSIRSPIDGVVAERYISVGERVEDKPLVRIAKVDPLKVQVVVPAGLYGKIARGARASIQPLLPDAGALSARVTLVDNLIDAPSNTFRVQLELPNPKLALPAGLRCQADFGLDQAGTPEPSKQAVVKSIAPTAFKTEPEPQSKAAISRPERPVVKRSRS